MKLLASPNLWFVCGSQHLYGPGPLKQVAANAEKVAAGLAKSKSIPLPIVYKALVTTPDEITQLCRDADNDPTAPASSSGCTPSPPRRCGSAASPR
jgi:L-arabinose isomerase